MNTKLHANAFVITSNITKKEMETLVAANSDALTLYEGEGDARKPVFIAGLGVVPCFDEHGITFDGTTHDGTGKLTCTVVLRGDLGDTPEKAQEILVDLYGKAVVRAKKWEDQVPGALAAIAAARNEAAALINV